MDRRGQTGRWGERAAGRYLVRRGWTVVARRWRGGGGEIDLIVRRRGVLAVCEVKVRRDDTLVHSPVGASQQARIRRATEALLVRHPHLRGHTVRLDLLTVRRWGPWARVRHHVGALEW